MPFSLKELTFPKKLAILSENSRVVDLLHRKRANIMAAKIIFKLDSQKAITPYGSPWNITV